MCKLLKIALQNKTESGKNDKNEIKTQVIKLKWSYSEFLCKLLHYEGKSFCVNCCITGTTGITYMKSLSVPGMVPRNRKW